MLTIAIFILILALLVLSHELGHFIAARRAGMRVWEFGFGFPPRIVGVQKLTGRDEIKKWRWIWGNKLKAEETDTADFKAGPIYSLHLLPLGGFCKIKGEEGEKADEPDSFGFQKAWKRAVVLVSGVSMNFLLAAVLMAVGFMVGLPADLSAGADSKAIIVEQPKVMVQYVDKGSPAEKADVKYGDQIISLNNELMENSEQMIAYTKAHNDKEMLVKVMRGKEEMSFNILPAIVKPGETAPRLGVMLADAGIIRYPWHISIYKGFVSACVGFVNIFIAFYLLIKNLILGQGLIFDVAGPVGIAVMVGQSARMGLHYLINLTAMLSLTLAAINILPIPALDGGRLLFIGLEKIFHRPMPMKYEQLAHTIGFVLLMGLIVLVTYRDVAGLVKGL